MKKYIAVIYILLFSLGLSSCDKDDDKATQEVFVGFLNSKMDVSEHSGVLDIPLVVSGVRDDINLNIVVNLSVSDGSAKKDVDYKLPESVVKINSAGNYIIQVTLIDNDDVNEIKNFKVSISSVIGATKTNISEVEVFVLSEDRPIPVAPNI